MNKMNERLQGTITNKLAGYGFIRAGEQDYFFHKSEVKGGFFNALEAGMEVDFIPARDEKGPKAIEINVK